MTCYDSPAPWDGGANCTDGFTSGTAALRDYLLSLPFKIVSIGGYNCRPNTGNPAQTSTHGEGRALDIFVPTRAEGDLILAFLLRHAAGLGVQYVVWWEHDHICPDFHRGAYGGPHPHRDHLHVELTRRAAEHLTAELIGWVVHGTPPNIGENEPMSTIAVQLAPKARVDRAWEVTGRLPFWRLVTSPDGTEGEGVARVRGRILGYNGARVAGAADVRWAGLRFREVAVVSAYRLLGIEALMPHPKAGKPGILVTASDGGTFFYPYT